jgi:UDP-glucuronate 4-epimerase
MNPSLLITGASGFVGLNLLEHTLSRGHAVVGLSSTPIAARLASRLHALPGRFVEVVGDVRDPVLLGDLFERQRIDRVVHMAAITAAAERERSAADTVVSVNLVGLAAVMTAAAAAGVRRFVSVSSIAIYGGQPPDGSLIDEDVAHAPETLYAITKSCGEAVTARLGTLHGLDWVVARLGRVFGPHEHDTGVRDLLSQIHQVNEHAAAGRAVAFERPCLKNWSYAPDVATRLALLADAPAHANRVYNLGSEHAWTLAEWCERLRTRHDDFRYRVGAARPGDEEVIDLGGPRDSGLLSWQRFADEFAPPASADLDEAFEGTMRTLLGTAEPPIVMETR